MPVPATRISLVRTGFRVGTMRGRFPEDHLWPGHPGWDECR